LRDEYQNIRDGNCINEGRKQSAAVSGKDKYIRWNREHRPAREIKLTSWSRVLLEKLKVPQLVKKFSNFYGI
jgi:hypothetical protein